MTSQVKGRLLYPPDAASRAFAAQYTALILILLTFVIGAFGMEEHPGSSSFPPPPIQSSPKPPPSFGEAIIKNPFFHEDVLPESWQAVLEVLRHHDVSAIITVHERASNYEGALSHIRSLALFLSAEGIRDEVVSVKARIGSEPQRVSVAFRWTAK